MPELLGSEIAQQIDGEIQSEVAEFRERTGEFPRLAILTDNYGHAPTAKYMALKDRVAVGLGMAVETYVLPGGLEDQISTLNERDKVHGIIAQLPLRDPDDTQRVTESVAPHKDVDGLGTQSLFYPATPLAILQLLDSHDVDYVNEPVALLGAGRLVGAPLFDMLQNAGALEVFRFDETSSRLDIIDGIHEASVIITAMGRPGLVTSDLFESLETPRVLVDAGTAEQDGGVVGDVSEELRHAALAHDWSITPKRGGVGPLTIRALLINTLDAATSQTPDRVGAQ